MSVDDEWTAFLCNNGNKKSHTKPPPPEISISPSDVSSIPECEELYISTKTKVLFLNQPIDINTIFWKIPVIPYWNPTEGVVKKQMKIVSKTPEEFQEYRNKLQDIPYYTQNIIKQIDNPAARRIKFKDERKITVGISKKDIMNCRGKVKNAFYNCFAIIFRIQDKNHDFREIHVKIFNTGKLEIPGIIHNDLLDTVKAMILNLISPHIESTIAFIDNAKEDSVLINSNFNCGFYINRERLHSILRSDKYRIESAYDSCSYPGVKCKFYFNNEMGLDSDKQTGRICQEDANQKMSELDGNNKYTVVSFMIFRTGSCLIVGNCSEEILRFIFDFIRNILQKEYYNISTASEACETKPKKTKLRKRTIIVENKSSGRKSPTFDLMMGEAIIDSNAIAASICDLF
jgi:hypothetical protein